MGSTLCVETLESRPPSVTFAAHNYLNLLSNLFDSLPAPYDADNALGANSHFVWKTPLRTYPASPRLNPRARAYRNGSVRRGLVDLRPFLCEQIVDLGDRTFFVLRPPASWNLRSNSASRSSRLDRTPSTFG
jgi:hypothetical protein